MKNKVIPIIVQILVMIALQKETLASVSFQCSASLLVRSTTQWPCIVCLLAAAHIKFERWDVSLSIFTALWRQQDQEHIC